MMSYSVAKVIIFSLPLPNNKEKSPHHPHHPPPQCPPRVRFATPASGSPMPRLPPRPLVSGSPPPRQGRLCRGSRRGPFARFVPRHRPRPRVRVNSAAAPAAAPVPASSRVSAPAPASGSAMPRPLFPPALSRGRRLCRRHSSSIPPASAPRVRASSPACASFFLTIFS